MNDLLLKNVVIHDGEQTDILINDGYIKKICAGQDEQTAKKILDGKGYYAFSGFVNAHTHPCQTFAGGKWVDYDYPDTVNKRAKAEKEYYDVHGRMNGVKNCYVQFREAIRRGTTYLRGHIDVGFFGLEEVEDALKAREDFKDVLDVDYVAMPSNGILNMTTDPSITIPQAVKMGVESIGGADPCDRDRDPVRSVELTMRLASETNADIDLHLHEFGEMGKFSFDLIVKNIKKYNLQNRVTISHAWFLANCSDEKYQNIANELNENGIGLITHVPGHVPFPSLKQAKRFNVKYGVGTDNMRSLWGPYGMNDMRERVMLLAYLSDFRKRQDLEMAFDAGTYGSAEVLRITDYGIKENGKADLVVYQAENRAQILLEGNLPYFVIKKGKLVAREGKLEDCVPSYSD